MFPVQSCEDCLTSLQLIQDHDTRHIRRQEDGSSALIISRHPRTLKGLHKSADGGCLFCSRLLECRQNWVLEEYGRNIFAEFSVGSWPDGMSNDFMPRSLTVKLEGVISLGWLEYNLHRYQSGCPRPRKSTASTASKQSWATAKGWLDDCIWNHKQCALWPNSLTPRHLLPTRLLDLGADESCLVRLISRSEIKSDSRYVTLSHCWGRASLLRLTRNTYSVLANGVSIDDLPLTFRHAVEIVRRLKVQYLWVDSLCIFQGQDDVSDWLGESQSMDRVYSYSLCNLAAAAAAESSQGLFFGELFDHLSVSLPVDLNDKSKGSTHYAIESDRHFLKDINSSPLNLRAWFQQERWMARRILFFSQTQLYWQCRVKYASEEWPVAVPRLENDFFGPYQYMESMIDFRPDQDEDYLPAPEEQQQAYASWWNICEQYSRCGLTRPGDKLVALSGLAKCVGRIVNDTYIAGMWRQHLVQDLLWYVWQAQVIMPGGVKSRRQLEYRAPTFSWASIDGPVNRHKVWSSEVEVLTKVLDVRLELISGQYGPVRGGAVRLYGLLREYRLRRWNAEGDWMYPNIIEEAEPGSVCPDVELDSVLENAYARGLLYLMLIECEKDGRDGEKYCVLRSLLLQCIDHCGGRFHRVGMTEERGLNDDIILEFFEPPYNVAQLPCISYDKEKDRHTIEIE